MLLYKGKRESERQGIPFRKNMRINKKYAYICSEIRRKNENEIKSDY